MERPSKRKMRRGALAARIASSIRFIAITSLLLGDNYLAMEALADVLAGLSVKQRRRALDRIELFAWYDRHAFQYATVIPLHAVQR